MESEREGEVGFKDCSTSHTRAQAFFFLFFSLSPKFSPRITIPEKPAATITASKFSLSGLLRQGNRPCLTFKAGGAGPSLSFGVQVLVEERVSEEYLRVLLGSRVGPVLK